MDYKWENAGIETHVLGEEEYVVIESGTKLKSRNNIYLDNDPDDRVTADFFRKQKHKPNYKRSYMDDAYGIIDGVALGFGRAVMSKHLVDKQAPIRIVSGFVSWKVDVVLHYYALPFYPKLHQVVVSTLCAECPKILTRVGMPVSVRVN